MSTRRTNVPATRRPTVPAAAPTPGARQLAIAAGGSLAERPTRSAVDVSSLPTVVFGSRGLVWWGTMGFVAVEAMTLAVCVATYFYLRRNFGNWPPLRTPLPRLGIPTASLLVLLLVIVPTRLYHRAAERLDRPATKRWLWVATLVAFVALGLRVAEFNSIGARWDLNAYTSATWAMVFAHFTLLLVSAFETLTIAAIFSTGSDEMKHFADAADNAGYVYFMTLSWVPMYLIVFLLPRWV